MDSIKAILLGGILTGVVSLVVGSNGSSGGHLHIHEMMIRTSLHTYEVYWSWPLFFAGTGLSYGIIWMQR
jgi:hypothetical protein